MWYALISEDHAGVLDKRINARPEHVARLKALCDEGRLLIAGPHPAVDSPDPGTTGFTGSLVVAEFPSLEEAKAWAADDPYMSAGVYSKMTVKPFNRVLP
ncbi:MAG: YciI family protein [Gammaproteobacteria bacterium]|nr:YciI family protein [Gammaproteobacteria bacterium]